MLSTSMSVLCMCLHLYIHPPPHLAHCPLSTSLSHVLCVFLPLLAASPLALRVLSIYELVFHASQLKEPQACIVFIFVFVLVCVVFVLYPSQVKEPSVYYVFLSSPLSLYLFHLFCTKVKESLALALAVQFCRLIRICNLSLT